LNVLFKRFFVACIERLIAIAGGGLRAPGRAASDTRWSVLARHGA
jgi:hypothetical protein